MRRIAYGPSTHPNIKVEECRLRLDASFFERGSIELFSGECKEMNMKLRNIGKEDISRLWIVLGEDDGLFLLPAPSEDAGRALSRADLATEIKPEWDIWDETRTFKSNLSNNPRTILNVSRYLPNETVLKAGESCVLPLAACYLESGEHDTQVLLISESVRQNSSDAPLYLISISSSPAGIGARPSVSMSEFRMPWSSLVTRAFLLRQMIRSVLLCR
jgi:hypothetical protein